MSSVEGLLPQICCYAKGILTNQQCPQAKPDELERLGINRMVGRWMIEQALQESEALL